MRFTTTLCALVFLAATLAAQPASLTARQVIDRIHEHLGVRMPASTVDTFKAGDPDTPVTGVALTMMATFDVLQRAAAEHKNLVITHEPTFYNHLDDIAVLTKKEDPVLRDKQAFIAANHLVVWRFHDGWHMRRPDGILLGMTNALGWTRYQSSANPALYTLPATTIQDLSSSIARKLNIHTLRVVGNPDLRVTRIAMLPGAGGTAKQIEMLERDDVEALLIGEVPEWETIEYVHDAMSEGHKKALILLGHIPSEQAGMEECAAWLKTFVTEVPVGFVPAREMFWSPAAMER